MKGWQRWLTFTLAMLLAWTPLCASHAQETTDSFCLRMALTVETNAASEAMHALGVHLDGEEQRTLDAMIALLNAAEVRIQLGLTGEQLRVSLVMSEIELLYLQEDVYQGTRYVTTNLMPGVALTVPQRGGMGCCSGAMADGLVRPGSGAEKRRGTVGAIPGWAV